MAEFGVQATQLTPPSGAGASVVGPVQGTILDNGVGKLIGGIADIFEKGLQIDAKNKAKQQETTVVTGYAKKLGAISDAVASGQMRPSEASARQRSLHSEYVAGYSQYVDEIEKVRKSFMGGSTLGDVEDKAKSERDLRNQRIQDAQKAGFPITVGMSDKTIDAFVDAHQVAVRTDAEFQRQVKQQEQDRAEGRWNNEVRDRENKERSVALLNNVSEINLNASSEYARDLAARTKAGKVTQEGAQLEWNGYMTRLNSQLQAAAGIDTALAAPYRSLFDNMNKLGLQLLDPANDAKQIEDQIKVVIGQQKMKALLQPNVAEGVAFSQLYGNLPEITLKFAGPALAAANKMATTPVGASTPLDPVIGVPQREQAAFETAKAGINSLRQGKNKDPEFNQGIINTINNSLSQVGDALGRPGVDAKYLKNVASFIASPEYGDYVSKNKVDPASNSAAIRTFQLTYEPQVLSGINKKLDEAFTVNSGLVPNRAASGATLAPTEKTFDVKNLKVNFTGSGVFFELTKAPTDPVERRNAQQTMQVLKEAQMGVNQLIHMGAHMEGSTNYAQYWEARKHILLPRFFADPAATEKKADTPGGLEQEKNMVQLAKMSEAEAARDALNETSDTNLKELDAELARPNLTADQKKILQEYRDRVMKARGGK